MISEYSITVVMPAYNAARTLEKTYNEIPFDIVDHTILVDDGSTDDTVKIARELGIDHVIVHKWNKGYGANLKTCYRKAKELNSDIVVLLHPDYQYTPKLIRPMCHMIADGLYPAIIASRMLGKGARKGGMPYYKYIFNRILTKAQNLIMGQSLSEYHSGYRVYSAKALFCLNYEANSDGFLFDNQMIAQLYYASYELGQIACPTKYEDDSSSASFFASLKYGIGVIKTAFLYTLQKKKLINHPLFLKIHQPNI